MLHYLLTDIVAPAYHEFGQIGDTALDPLAPAPTHTGPTLPALAQQLRAL